MLLGHVMQTDKNGPHVGVVEERAYISAYPGSDRSDLAYTPTQWLGSPNWGKEPETKKEDAKVGGETITVGYPDALRGVAPAAAARNTEGS